MKKRKATIVLLSLLSFVASSLAAEMTMMDAVKTEAMKDGTKRNYIDFTIVDRITNQIANHAREYPPTFQNAKERGEIESELRRVLAGVDTLLKNDTANPQLLIRSGFLYSMAHNLDLPFSAEKAAKAFDALLEVEPDNPRGNYLYGMFLSSTRKYQSSARYLEHAMKLGIEEAKYTLGLNFLREGKDEVGLQYLEEYAKTHPESRAHLILKGHESGKLVFEERGSKWAEGLKQISTETELGIFTNTYYLHPQPELIAQAISFLSSSKILKKNRNAGPPTLGFFARVFGDNPESVAEWKKVIKKQDRKTRKLLNRAIKTELETLLSETETGAALNDMYWGAFFASGERQYVDRLIGQLKYLGERHDINRYIAAATAKWSLSNNAKRHPDVKLAVEGMKNGNNPEHSDIAEDILSMEPKTIQDEMTAVLKEQKAKGVW